MKRSLTVRLPDDGGAGWRLEQVHCLVWRDLLDLLPGALQGLLDQAAGQLGLAAGGLGTGATIAMSGKCGADLFAVCDDCQGDRAVLEIKGPRASMNLGEGGWQTDRYRDTYRQHPGLCCQHAPHRLPLLILLDGRNRTRQEIEQREGRYERLDLSDWAVLTYQEVLSSGPFVGRPHSAWLLGS